MKNFTYTGKQMHVSTINVKDKDGKPAKQDLILANGDNANLDEKHPVIKSMIETGLLVETKQNSTQTKP